MKNIRFINVERNDGLKEIQSLFSSSIIGAGSADMFVFSGLLILFVGFLALRMRRLTLYLSDPVMAAAVGANIFLWSAAIASSLGLATGLAIRSSGMLFTFGCLILPAQMAKIISRDIPRMFMPIQALFSLRAICFKNVRFVQTKRPFADLKKNK